MPSPSRVASESEGDEWHSCSPTMNGGEVQNQQNLTLPSIIPEFWQDVMDRTDEERYAQRSPNADAVSQDFDDPTGGRESSLNHYQRQIQAVVDPFVQVETLRARLETPVNPDEPILRVLARCTMKVKGWIETAPTETDKLAWDGMLQGLYGMAEGLGKRFKARDLAEAENV
ncbi:MAG: hypothetical protein Q9218_003426 [Villophora microphyllina]